MKKERKKERKKEIIQKTNNESFSILSEYNKNLPTEIHSAFASLGAFLGGSDNFEYLAKYATKYQIYNSEKNIEYAKKINYSDNETKELDKSGIIAIPATLAVSLLALPKSQNVLGSIPIDEINTANKPADLYNCVFNKEKEDIKHPGFIMDKYYRSIFSGLELDKEYAIYGENNVMRDHYADFYGSLKDKDYELLRCKHYCMPIIDVNSIDLMKALISKIPKRSESGIFFRGQTSFYELQREDRVQKNLFGNSESKEPSLITSASRTNYNYDHLHFILKYFLEHEIVFKDYDNKKIKKNIFKKLEELKKSFHLKLDYAVMALAQHYGLPTHGLDVTTNLDVAVWFATNRFKMENDKATYTKMDTNEWNKNKSKWPTVFVFQNVLNSTSSSLQDCVELEEIGLKALRPQRQSAKFFHAAHSDHQNRLAESLVCAFRLCPNNYETEVDFDYLFPSPDEDEAYEFMINFAENEMLSVLNIPRKTVTKFH
ncbi:MAG: FRG domain-containing protein [Sulfuricurvum sp.]|uniref:FRG domain-containing protein n=1 Tax=Sulfuricurvum sp. TaxID=2025608 RepID=UPI00263458BA|nr:FRG domain-containing protein [Sulfuricurvum sp.]MDD5160500.1 FRG domain-containing protein [Sulfuricurvum sp.]